MPLKITNELIDDFYSLPGDQAGEVYDSLDDNDKVALDTAFTARTAGKLVDTPEEPAYDPSTYTPNRTLGQPDKKSDFQTAMGNPADYDARPELNELVELGQKHVGTPVAGTLIEALPTVKSPSLKVLGRDAVTRIAGPEIQDYGINPSVKAQGEETLENFGKFKVGPVESSVGGIARGAVTEAGNPANYIPLGWEAKAESLAAKGFANAPMLFKYFGKPAAHMLAAGAENAAIDTATGVATNAENIPERALNAFIGGAVTKPLTHGIGLASKELKYLSPTWAGKKAIQAVDGKEWSAFMQELSDVQTRPWLDATTSAGKEIMGTPKAANLVFKDGAIHGQVVFENPITGLPAVREIALTSMDKAKKFRKVVDAGKIPTSQPFGNEDFDINFNKLDDDLHYVISGAYQGAGMPKEVLAKVSKRNNETLPGGRKSSPDGKTAELPIAKQPLRGETLVTQNPDGSHSFEAIKAAAKDIPDNNYQPGNAVVVNTANGPIVGKTSKQLPDGKYEVTGIDGTKHQVEGFNLRDANEAEVLSAASKQSGAEPIESILRAVQSSPTAVSLKELAAHSGMDLVETRNLLGKLEDAGWITHGNGDWGKGKEFPKLPPSAKVLPPTNLPEIGSMTYVEGYNGGKEAVAEILSTNGKSVKVRFAKNEAPIDVPISKLRPLTPPGIANLRSIIPEGPKFDGPPPDVVPMNQMMDFQLGHDVLKQFSKRENFGTKFLESLENQRHRGPLDLQRFVKEGQASLQHAKVKDAVMESIQKSVPKGTSPQFFKDVHEMALGHMSDIDMGQKYPDIWNAAREKVVSAIGEAKSNDQIIASLGGIPEDLITARAEGAVDQYVARKFRAYLDADNWAKNVPAVVEQNVIAKILKDNPNTNWTEQTVAHELAKFLKSEDPLKAFSESSLGAKYTSALKTRKDIPPEVRAFMGEIDNGAISLAETIGNQRAIIQNLKVWSDIVADPRYFSPGPRVDAAGRPMVQVPMDRKSYGVAAGGFVDRDVMAGLDQVKQHQGAFTKFLQGITGYVKGNEVGTLKGIYNSTIGNMVSIAGMGKAGLDLQHGVGDLKTAYQALKDFRVNPTKLGVGNIVKEATTYGAYWGGQVENELGLKSAFEQMDKLYGKDVKAANVFDLWGKLKTIAKSPYTGIRAYQKFMGGILDANDGVIRLANYISARRHYMSPEGGSLPVEGAARAAAKDINDVFWNAQHVGKLIETARSNGAGFVAKYLTAYTEDLRIWKNMSSRLVTRPDTRFRVLGAGLMLSGGAMALKASLGDDDLGGKDNFTKRTGSYSPLMIPLPITENGKRIHYDMTQHFPIAKFAQGHPDDALWRRVISNIALGPVEGGAAEGPVREWIEGTGFIRPFTPGRPPIEGDTGWWKTVENLWKMGALPKLPGNLMKEYDKTQQRGIYPPTQGIGTAAARSVLPLVTEPATNREQRQELVGEVQKLTNDLQAALKMGRTDLVPAIKARLQFLQEQANPQ